MVHRQVLDLREKGYSPREKTIAQNCRYRGKEGLSGKGQKPVSWLTYGFHQGLVCLIHYVLSKQIRTRQVVVWKGAVLTKGSYEHGRGGAVA